MVKVKVKTKSNALLSLLLTAGGRRNGPLPP